MMDETLKIQRDIAIAERDAALANLSKVQGECDVLIAAVAEAHDEVHALSAKLGEIEAFAREYSTPAFKYPGQSMKNYWAECCQTILSRFFPEVKVEETR